MENEFSLKRARMKGCVPSWLDNCSLVEWGQQCEHWSMVCRCLQGDPAPEQDKLGLGNNIGNHQDSGCDCCLNVSFGAARAWNNRARVGVWAAELQDDVRYREWRTCWTTSSHCSHHPPHCYPDYILISFTLEQTGRYLSQRQSAESHAFLVYRENQIQTHTEGIFRKVSSTHHTLRCK